MLEEGYEPTEWILWGEDQIHPKDGTKHFLVVGASGSGKTLLIKRLYWSLFQNPQRLAQKGLRAVIYDPKQEIVSLFGEPSLRSRLRILHPFDTRSYCWDLAKDIDSPIVARQMATILIPESAASGANPFFDNAVRDLLTGVMLVFMNCTKGNTWTLRDVILAMLYEPYLRYLLSYVTTNEGELLPITARLLSSYLEGDPKTTANIRGTINSHLSIYEPIAAVWQQAWDTGRRLSLTEWVETDQILILGNDEAARSSLDAINQAMFKRLTEILLSQPETHSKTGEGYTWIILDEVREAGKLDGLSRLMTKSRSKGVCVVLGFQDIDGLRSVYGAEIANEITGQCQNIAILQVSNPTTAEWASQLFGKTLMQDQGISANFNTGGEQTRGISYSLSERGTVFTGELIFMPKTNEQNGLTGYYRIPGRTKEEGYRVTLQWNEIVDYMIDKTNEPDFLPRPTSEHYLKPWDDTDWKRLGFMGLVPKHDEEVLGGVRIKRHPVKNIQGTLRFGSEGKSKLPEDVSL
jgi:type IV secretory pathway TraG/TraD family ATPase VirD4